MKQIMYFTLIVLSTACVSKKQYLEALEDIERLRNDSTVLHDAWNAKDAEFDSLRYAFADFQNSADRNMASLMSKLNAKTADLVEKEGLLSERAARLRELQEQVSAQNDAMQSLRRTLRDALVDIPAQDLQVEIKDGKIYINLSENLLFGSGSVIVDPRGKAALKSVAQVLTKNPNLQIEVVGHTDSIPIRTARFSDNWDLSVARATSITRILVDEYSVDGKNIKAAGRSEYKPVGSNQTPEGRARNRRTEIVLSPDLEKLFRLVEE